MNLQTKVVDAGRSFKMYAKRLEKLDIQKMEDFLYHIPFRYENYSLISPIRQVQPGETLTIQGTVVSIANEYTKRFKKIQKATITDDSGQIDVIWFNQPYLTNVIRPSDKISLSGTIGWFAGKRVMESPDYEILYNNDPPIHTGRLVPVYPETHGVSSKWLRRQVFKLLSQHKSEIIEYLPKETLEQQQLVFLQDALQNIHFPNNTIGAEKARQRLAFDELLLIRLKTLRKKREWEETLSGFAFSVKTHEEKIQEFWKKLPFELTGAQKKAIKDIFSDVSVKKPMNRLLEGEVGSGKTVVATVVMYLAFLNGFESVLMAPTEILATQHYATISTLLKPLGVRVQLVTGSRKIGIKNKELRIKGKNHNFKFAPIDYQEHFDILIGTHALLSESVKFKKLGLVVIDEQQRFGVEQRALIRKKGESPHVLTMTATPIPRTVALTMYGDLDLSYLDEMPKGRKIVKTWLVPKEKRQGAYEWIEKQLKQTDSQAFIICPFIEESESMQTVKAATKEFAHLSKNIFPNLKLGMLHGKLKARQKNDVLNAFKNKEIDILVATPVVEVGIDIPNATIMLIEAADRFGLAQLHQLRGRVGRGDKQSYCLLFTESPSEHTIKRLKAMETMFDGAQLAQLDLELRGPGDVFGTAQHGVPKLRVASFSDFTLIERTKIEAERIFKHIDKYSVLKSKVTQENSKEVSNN